MVDPDEHSSGSLRGAERPRRVPSTTARTRPRLRAVTAVRVGWGAALIAAPRPLLRGLARADGPADRVAVAVLRVLGVRHVAQAVGEMLGPQPIVRYLGAAVDGLHALTAVGLAVLDPRWRRGALHRHGDRRLLRRNHGDFHCPRGEVEGAAPVSPSEIAPHVLREYALLADGERGALVGPRGDIAWMCAPRWHSDAVFSSLIGGGGVYAVTPIEPVRVGRLLRGRQPDLAVPLGDRDRDHRVPRGAGVPRRSRTAPSLLRRVDGRSRRRPGAAWSWIRRPSSGRADTARPAPRPRRRLGGPRRRPVRCAGPGGAARAPARLAVSGSSGRLTLAPEGGHHDLVLEIGRPRAGRADPRTRTGLGGHRERPGATRRAQLHGQPRARATPATPTPCCAGSPAPAAGWSPPPRWACPSGPTRGRNYDYRYVWIRDQCYAGQAVAADGDLPAARRRRPLRRRTPARRRPAPAPPPTPSPAVACPTSASLDLPGYPGGTDIVGNHVNAQFQLDAFGEALLLFAAAARHDRLDSEHRKAVDRRDRRDRGRRHEPDAGIWELDDHRWTHSRLICAAGLRAIAGARARRPTPWAGPSRWPTRSSPTPPTTACTPTGAGSGPRTTHGSTPRCCCRPCAAPCPPTDPRVGGDAAGGGRGARPTTATSTASGTTTAPARRRPRARSCCAGSGWRWPPTSRAVRRRRLRWFERNRAACGPPGLFTEEYDVTQRQMRGNLPQAFVARPAARDRRRLRALGADPTTGRNRMKGAS